MKYVAWLLVFLLLLAFIGVGYVYVTAQVVTESTMVTFISAGEATDLLEDYRRRLENGTVHGTVFENKIEGAAEEYLFLTYTVRLRNDCFIAADMVEMQVVPWEGYDILQVGDERAKALQPRSKGDLSATVLSKWGTHSVREAVITYYMWGMPFTLRVTIAGA